MTPQTFLLNALMLFAFTVGHATAITHFTQNTRYHSNYDDDAVVIASGGEGGGFAYQRILASAKCPENMLLVYYQCLIHKDDKDNMKLAKEHTAVIGEGEPYRASFIGVSLDNKAPRPNSINCEFTARFMSRKSRVKAVATCIPDSTGATFQRVRNYQDYGRNVHYYYSTYDPPSGDIIRSVNCACDDPGINCDNHIDFYDLPGITYDGASRITNAGGDIIDDLEFESSGSPKHGQCVCTSGAEKTNKRCHMDIMSYPAPSWLNSEKNHQRSNGAWVEPNF